LWWPHNEATLATLYAFRLTQDREFLDWFHRVHEYAFTHFRDPEYGEWYGYLNRQGIPTHTLKGGKWKTFFHLPRSLLCGIEQMKLYEGLDP
jgi:N-acylglucosamine 2-epimerase